MQISELTKSTMQYPLHEKIGDPDLFVGRKEEFESFHEWIEKMPRLMAQSRVLLARRKSGKTALVQRLFNQLWSANGRVIPFYFSIPETAIWYPAFALMYYRTFATQYISFLERDSELMQYPLEMAEIRAYGEANSISSFVRDVDNILTNFDRGLHGLMWDTAYRAPHRMASVKKRNILVIIDEFQYLSNQIYTREDLSGDPLTSMPGSYHEVAESKVAPMLVTGSYVGWMLDIMRNYLKAGRLRQVKFSSYLDEDAGLIAVYKYAHGHNRLITNETAVQLNKLCQNDPFFINCVMENSRSKYDLTTPGGVVYAVNNEAANPDSYLSRTCQEYIDNTVDRINDRYGKHMLLHLSQNNDREWTPRDLKEKLQLPEDERAILHKLNAMATGDIISKGSSNIRFRGLQDGTLNLVLRHRFEEEILEHRPDFAHDFNQEIAHLTRENRRLRGKLSHIKGVVTEMQFANTLRDRKRFRMSEFFNDVTDDTRLNMADVRARVFIQRADGGNNELDIVAQTSDDRTLLVEVKNQEKKANPEMIEAFLEKVATYQTQHPDRINLKGFLSLNSFTKKGLEACREHDIAWTTDLQYF